MNQQLWKYWRLVWNYMPCECERIDNIFNHFSQQESLGKSISLGLYAKLDAPATKQNIVPENFRICSLKAAL